MNIPSFKMKPNFSSTENRPGLVACKFISKYNWMVFHGKDVLFECTFNLIQKSLCLLMDCVANIVECRSKCEHHLWPTPHPNALWLAPRFHAVPCNCRKITNHKNLNIFLLRKHLLPTHTALEMKKKETKKSSTQLFGKDFICHISLWKCISNAVHLVEMHLKSGALNWNERFILVLLLFSSPFLLRFSIFGIGLISSFVQCETAATESFFHSKLNLNFPNVSFTLLFPLSSFHS